MATIKFQNGQTVNFNGNPTPEDVDFVAKQLGIGPSTPPPAPVPAPQMGLPEKTVRAVGNVAVGAAKGIGSTIAGASSLGERLLLDPVTRLMGGKVPEKTLGKELQETALKPEGTAQKIGFGAEQLAEFFVPGAAPAKVAGVANRALKVAKVAEEAPGLLKAGRAVGRLATRAGTEAGIVGGQTAMQTGSVEEGKKAATIGAASVPVFGTIGKVIGGVGRVGMEALGRSTGAGEAALREAFNNPNVMKFARQGADAVTSLQEQALEGAQRGLGNMARQRGAEYVRALEKIKADPQILREVTENAINVAREALENASVRIGKKGALLPTAFRESAIEQGKNSVVKAYRVLSTWKDHTPAGLDRLKKKLGQFVTATKNTTDGSYAAIKAMRTAVDEGLKTFVPGYTKMTAKYREATEIIEEIERALSLKDSAARDTAIRKLMSTMRQNNEMRLDFLKTLGVKSGKDVTGQIAGATLAPLTPRGLSGVLSGPASLGAFSLGNIPGLLAYLAASSPRLVGEAVSILGRTKGKIPTEEIKKALNALIIQSQRENDTGQ